MYYCTVQYCSVECITVQCSAVVLSVLLYSSAVVLSVLVTGGNLSLCGPAPGWDETAEERIHCVIAQCSVIQSSVV